MKSIFFLLLSLPVIGFTQIPRNANTIIVKGVGFLEVCNALLDSGYNISMKDDALQTAVTEPKVYPKHWNAAYKIYVRVKDSVATLKGTCTAPWVDFLTKASNKTDPLWKDDPVYNQANKKGDPYPKSLFTYPFLIINKFALTFGKPVEYEIRK